MQYKVDPIHLSWGNRSLRVELWYVQNMVCPRKFFFFLILIFFRARSNSAKKNFGSWKKLDIPYLWNMVCPRWTYHTLSKIWYVLFLDIPYIIHGHTIFLLDMPYFVSWIKNCAKQFCMFVCLYWLIRFWYYYQWSVSCSLVSEFAVTNVSFSSLLMWKVSSIG